MGSDLKLVLILVDKEREAKKAEVVRKGLKARERRGYKIEKDGDKGDSGYNIIL